MSGALIKAMILAAGRGERMRPLTDDKPKPLVSLCGRALIEHGLERLIAAGVREFVINLGYRGAQIREHLGDGARWGVRIEYSDEGESTLETGGGVLRALPLLGASPFLLVNADVYSDYDYAGLIARAVQLPTAIEAHLVLVPNPSHRPQGDFALVDGLIPDPMPQSAASSTFSGLSILSPALLAGCTPGRFPLAPLLRAAAQRGVLSGEVFDGLWSDVGTPQRLLELEQRLNSRR